MTDAPDTNDRENVAADYMPTQEEVAEVLTGVPAKLRAYSHDELKGIDSFKAAVALANSKYGMIAMSKDVLGDGFTILKDKSSLVNIPFVILDWEEGKNVTKGDGFVIIRLVTEANHKVIITDGSTGIYKQLKELREMQPDLISLYVENGLRISEFWVSDETNEIVDESYKGKKTKAATFYITT